MLHTVIMAGGSGTRFWPQSRRALPKQFLTLGSERTLIQQTADRCLPLSATDRVWVVTGAQYGDETYRQLPWMPSDQLLIEPCARNTAPCIGLAAIQLLARDPDATMLVVPADHLIQPAAAFQAAVQHAAAFVSQNPDQLVLFGVPPTSPATGFGYIEQGATIPNHTECYRVASFREKPDRDTALRYLAAGTFLWNCGIFVWKAQTLLQALAQWQPALHAGLLRLAAVLNSTTWTSTLAVEFPQFPSLSIDYAVLEHAVNVCVLPAPFVWDDVGSWDALARMVPADAEGNTLDGLHCGVDTRRCIVRSSSSHLIATVGVNDLLIVHTPEITLVADRRDETAVKRLLAEVERRGLTEYL